MRWTLVIIFIILCILCLFGTVSNTEKPEDKKSYKELSAIFGALAILAAVIVW